MSFCVNELYAQKSDQINSLPKVNLGTAQLGKRIANTNARKLIAR